MSLLHVPPFYANSANFVAVNTTNAAVTLTADVQTDVSI